MFRKFITLFLLFIYSLVLADVPLDRIVAVVDDDVVMKSELEEKVRTVIKQLQEQNTNPPPLSIIEKQVLDRMILNKLQLQLASHTGIRVDDETLNRTISNIASENNLSLAQFREILEQDGYKYEKFREDIRNEITISRLKQRAVDNRVTVTEREIDNLLKNQEIQGNTHTEYLLSHILIATPEAASPEEIEQSKLVANKVLNDLADGQDFAELAAAISDGQQALDGGNLGWRKLEQIPTLFTDYVTKMEKGDVSGLIQSPSGFHIIKLSDIKSTESHIVTQTHARHILIIPNDVIPEKEVITRLEQLKIRIDGGDDFGQLAQANSEDPVSAVEGGDLGWRSEGDLVPEFEQEMNALKEGEVSKPFKTPFGWHIVQVLGRREINNAADMKRSKAREIIRNRKIEEAHQNWLRSLRDEAYVEYRIDGY